MSSFEYFNVESAHNGFNRRVNVRTIIKELHFRIFEWSKTDVLNRQGVIFKNGDYWLWLQLFRVQSNATTLKSK